MTDKIGAKILATPLSNIPLINLRFEFRDNYNFLSDPDNYVYFSVPHQPIRTKQMIWGGMPSDFLTLLMQRGIVGLESYVPNAVWTVLVYSRKWKTEEHLQYIKNPYSLPGKGSVPQKYYNQLPELVSKDITLIKYDSELWKTTSQFYSKVRNPIFHGKQFSTDDPTAILDGYKLIAKIYEWVDSWYSPEDLWPGASAACKVQI